MLTLLLACAPPAALVDWIQPDRAPTAWTQYRAGPTHTGLAPAGAAVDETLTRTWATAPLSIGDYSASRSSPALDEDHVYIGLDDGTLRAFDRETGAPAWTAPTHRADVEAAYEDSDHRGIHSSPAVDDDHVYIGDYSGYLYAFDKTTGDPVWEVKLGGSIGASPVLYAGQVLISVEYPDPDGAVFAVDAATGAITYAGPRLGDHPHGTVTVDPARGWIYIGANNGHFSAFDLSAERRVWTHDLDGEIKSTAALVDDTVYITSWDQQLHAYDAESGEERFAVMTDSLVMSSPSVYDGLCYFGSHDSGLYAVDTTDGAILWRADTGASITSSPTLIPDRDAVLIGSNDGNLYLFDRLDGSVRWQAPMAGGLTGVPVVEGHSLFVFDDQGTLSRFDAAE